MPTMQVVLGMADLILVGKVTFNQSRLIDLLNTSIQSCLTLQEPTIKPLRNNPVVFPGVTSAVAARREIFLAIPFESKESLELRTEHRFFSYQPKVTLRVLLSVPPYRVAGRLNLPVGTTVEDILVGAGDDFLAVTDVESLYLAESAISVPPVVIVNRAKIAFVCTVSS